MRRGREICVDPGSFEFDVSTLLDVEEDVPTPLLDLLETMDEPMRSVVEMVAIGRLGKAETARQLGLSRQWVQRLWKQAKVEMVDALRSDG